MTAARTLPRRTCPACARRYAGLVSPDCIICKGIGTLTIGAAALHYYPANAVARAVELYLETAASHANHNALPSARPAILEAAADQLRIAGVLATIADAAAPPSATAPPIPTSLVDGAARKLAARLGHTPTTDAPTQLAARPKPVTAARRTRAALPHLSANGHPSHLAQVTDPIDPLGPDTSDLAREHRKSDYTATVIASSVPEAIRRKDRRRK